ncbi:MAG: ABC transporter substrate-binding protein [Acidimicrobiia bacterium]
MASEDARIQSFVSAFRERYGRAADAFAAQGYDSYRVMQLAAEKATEFTGPSLRNALHTLGRYVGPGGAIEFNEHGDVEKPLRLIVVRDGQFTEYKE